MNTLVVVMKYILLYLLIAVNHIVLVLKVILAPTRLWFMA